jgi:hypothetical protein
MCLLNNENVLLYYCLRRSVVHATASGQPLQGIRRRICLRGTAAGHSPSDPPPGSCCRALAGGSARCRHQMRERTRLTSPRPLLGARVGTASSRLAVHTVVPHCLTPPRMPLEEADPRHWALDGEGRERVLGVERSERERWCGGEESAPTGPRDRSAARAE